MENSRICAAWPEWTPVKVIGAGSFGTVYDIQRDVFGHTEHAALKVVTIPRDGSEIEELQNEGYEHESISAHFKECLEDIIREYSLMLKIRGHANIVYCDDIKYLPHEDRIGWDIFIKMELLTPMLKYIDHNYNEAQVIKLGIDICKALQLCREKNIVHRDIKPQNIFVSPSGDFKLGDFGIAKISDQTVSGTKIGTYEFMAPEIYNNKPYGTSSDLYSLGMVLYWMMNDRHCPFLPPPPQIPSSAMKEDAYRRRFSGEPLPPPAHGSEALRTIVSTACGFTPAMRYTSPAQMRNALEMLYTNGSSGFTPSPISDTTNISGTISKPVLPPKSDSPFDRLPAVGPNLQITLPISIEDACFGCTKSFWVDRYELCRKCTPESYSSNCSDCKGTALVVVKRKVTAKIPAGALPGTEIHTKGLGHAGSSENGDLLITTSLLPHPVYTVNGLDIHAKVSISTETLQRGGLIQVPTLMGPAVYKIPPNTHAGTVFTMDGYGIPDKNDTSHRGNHVFTVIQKLTQNNT